MKKSKQKDDFQTKVEIAKRIFPSHCLIRLRIKDNPVNPFDSTAVGKIIELCHSHPEYLFYIHSNNGYARYTCPSIENFEDVKVPLDDKLWIELLSVFDFVEKVEKD